MTGGHLSYTPISTTLTDTTSKHEVAKLDRAI